VLPEAQAGWLPHKPLYILAGQSCLLCKSLWTHSLLHELFSELNSAKKRRYREGKGNLLRHLSQEDFSHRQGLSLRHWETCQIQTSMV
jgi:hypothetical protein